MKRSFWIVGIGLIAAGCASGDDDGGDGTGNKLTAVEAACGMLRDGETAQFTYEVMVDVLKEYSFEYPDTEAAARQAVQEAQAQGC